MESPLRRHPRACRGHPRLSCSASASKRWMAGTLEKWSHMTGTRCSGSGVGGLPFWRRNRAPRTRAFCLRFSFRRSALPFPLRRPATWAAAPRQARQRRGKIASKGACSNVVRSIRPHLRGCFWRGHVRCGAGADPGARDARAGVNIVQDRRCLQVDKEAMESGKGQMGQRKRKVGRLREASEGSKAHRPEELVIPCLLHDQLLTSCGLGAFFPSECVRITFNTFIWRMAGLVPAMRFCRSTPGPG